MLAATLIWMTLAVIYKALLDERPALCKILARRKLAACRARR